jgi:hypothetical protein
MTTPAYPSSTVNTPLGRPAPTPPSTVKGAFLVYVLAAALSVVTLALTLTSDAWNQAIAAAGDSVDTSGMSEQSLINTAKTVVIVISVVFILLYLFFAMKMRAGRNWARIVLTVLSALSILSAVRSSASVTVNGQAFAVGGSQLIGWVGAILAVVAIVLMYMGASNAYFTASKAARKGL